MADAPETAPVPVPMIGSYRLVEPLGSGGMSSVFRAVHKDTGHEVAVKVLPRYLAKNPTLLQRFLREAKSAESLEDPNVVAIYDRGSESGRHYLVLEYVPGGDLHDRVREGGPLPVKEAIDAARQVSSGLKHAAGRGLIHRDIKPANILRTPDGRVKLTDLGLALQMEDEDQRVTRDGTTVGTVDYMAPEQARDSRATSMRSDIYSLGCTLYYLLTGTPPFAGGDVAEKLKAHATEPAPDAHKARPEVPEILARLVQKMMAKKPEKRFRDYDQLIETLDAVAAMLDAPGGSADAPPLMALIDDEDDSLPGSSLPLVALIDDEDGAPTGALRALIDDEDDDDGFALGPGGPTRSAGSTISSVAIVPDDERPRTNPDQWDLAGLAAIEKEGTALPSARRPSSAGVGPSGSRVGSGQAPALGSVPGPPPEDAYDLQPAIQSTPHLYQLPAPEMPRTPASVWIIRLTLSAVAAMVIAFAWSELSPRLFRATVVEVKDKFLEAGGGGGTEVTTKGPAPWSEPADRDEPIPDEAPVPSEVLARLGMPDAAAEAPPRDEAPDVTIRRVDAVRDAVNLGDLPRAFDKLTGVVGIADDGPIVEENFRVSGQSRVIRARPGYRPILVVAKPEAASVKARPAAFVLDHQRLVVEGIDFVIQGADLSPRQESLFLCKGADLTLRDCTFTVVGPVKHAYAIIQVGDRGAVPSPPSSAVRVERTRIRGDASAIRLAGAATVTIARSAVASGEAPAIAIAGEPSAERSVAIFRSALASRAAMLDVIGSAGSADAAPATIRAAESSFAAIGGGKAAPSFVRMSEIPAGPARARPLATWRGEANRFDGWAGWSSAAPQGVLAMVRGIDPEAERRSRESPTPWPPEASDPWSAAAVPPSVAKDLASPLLRVARPAAMIREKAAGTFSRPAIATRAEAKGVQDLRFDADDAAYSGDLGRFLVDRPESAAKVVRVAVSGSGRHDFTPAKMPEGVSLEVTVSPPKPGASPVIWTTPEGSTGDALIAVKDAVLSLSGARFTATPKTDIEFLIAVRHGNLFLDRCVLMGPGAVENEGAVGGLILFHADGTRPYPHGAAEARALVDRPSCVLTDSALITGGDALTAEVGRGVVALTNCAIAAESSALVLRPKNVRRDRFDADLILDRCTIAAARNLVSLDAWPGLSPGPDRPWVLRSTSCVFTDAYQAGGGSFARGVALRTAIGGLDRGVLLWDSTEDVYDLAQFTSAGAAVPPSGRSDLKRSWVDLWGASRIRSPLGPGAVRFLGDRPRPGEAEPKDLTLDPAFPKGRTALDVGADLVRAGISGTGAR